MGLDPWVPNIPNFVPQLNPRWKSLESLPASLLVNKRNGRWNSNKIKTIFIHEHALHILKLLLPRVDIQDILIWLHNKNDVFSVKSMVSKLTSTESSNLQLIDWKKWWKRRVPPRLLMLGWRLTTYILPTRVILCKKGIADSNLCPICCSDLETIKHLFIQCDLVRCLGFSFIGVRVDRWTSSSPLKIIKHLVDLEASNNDPCKTSF